MYETIVRLFFAGKLSENGLENAVKKGWITQEQAAVLLMATTEQIAPETEQADAPAEQTDDTAELEGTSDG